MAQPHLRIYYGPDDQVAVDGNASGEPQVERVTVALSDVIPLLVDAIRDERTWLRDFSEDEITISSDLYEVLLAYQHYRRRPSA